MKEHQEFVSKLRRSLRVLRNRRKKKKASTNRYYELRENPKRAQKFPLDHHHRLGITRKRRKKKRLIRCEECGKGFRYEKCLLNHLELEEYMRRRRRSLLCSSFSDVQRRKRSKRVFRYSVLTSSSSLRRFPVSVDDEELLEVAESLILLSKNGEFVDEEAMDSNLGLNLRKARDFEDRFLSNERKLVLDTNLEMNLRKVREFEEGILSDQSDGISKEFSGFLRDKKGRGDDESSGGFVQSSPTVKLQGVETDIERKFGCEETGFEDSNSGNSGFEMKISSESGFLGDKKDKENDESGGEFVQDLQKQIGEIIFIEEIGLERVRLKDRFGLMLRNGETVIDQKLEPQETVFEHRCGYCDKVLSSYQALGGHQTFHRMRIRSKSQKPRDAEKLN